MVNTSLDAVSEKKSVKFNLQPIILNEPSKKVPLHEPVQEETEIREEPDLVEQPSPTQEPNLHELTNDSMLESSTFKETTFFNSTIVLEEEDSLEEAPQGEKPFWEGSLINRHLEWFRR